MKRTKKSDSRPSTKQPSRTTRRREVSDTDLKQVAGGAGTITHRKAGKGQQEFTISHTLDKSSPTLF
jgi:type VI protein secretion system component Hcp